jgi:hypothetical protein
MVAQEGNYHIADLPGLRSGEDKLVEDVCSFAA